MKLREVILRGSGEPEPHTLAGAYAMDAISAPDRSRFERHLARCDACAEEVDSLREATARLAAATAVSPPAGLKAHVMAVAALTRQQPPPAAARDSRPARIPAGIPARFWSLAWPGRLVLAGGAAFAVVMLALVVVFGTSNGSMQQQLDQATASSRQIAAVLTAQDATMMTGQVLGGGTVTVVMSHSRGALVFTASGLRALPASRGYELWLVGPGGSRPVGMLPAASNGMISPVIASGLRPGDHLVLTAEPAGGAPHPTMPMMLDLVL